MPKPKEPRSGASKSPRKHAEDVVLLGPRAEDGDGRQVLRFREGRVEVGAVQPLVHGKPIAGEVVTLTPREECPVVCDVEVHHRPAESESGRAVSAGPAQVASDRYRKNWDTIFKRRELAN